MAPTTENPTYLHERLGDGNGNKGSRNRRVLPIDMQSPLAASHLPQIKRHHLLANTVVSTFAESSPVLLFFFIGLAKLGLVCRADLEQGMWMGHVA